MLRNHDIIMQAWRGDLFTQSIRNFTEGFFSVRTSFPSLKKKHFEMYLDEILNFSHDVKEIITKSSKEIVTIQGCIFILF